MKRIGVLTSGGDAPGMNAAIRAVVRVGIYRGLKVSGINRGYQGLIEGDIVDMDLSSVGDIIHRGGTKLRTARSMEFMKEEGQKRGIEVLNMFDIDGLIVIGGDGSFTGALKLHNLGFPVVCIPGTIDNDLWYTDNTIGFDTAINTVVSAISNIRDTSSSHGRVSIIEVMGRECGDIALYSGIAGGAESIIVPEFGFDIDTTARRIIEGRNRGKLHHIVILAEGVGRPYEIADEIGHKTQMETRVTVIGHLQRGGTPSAYDRILASQFGEKAVELLMQKKSGLAIGNKGAKIIHVNIEDAIAKKEIPHKNLYELANMLSK
ncbi:MAG: 6-phosphofructokinase [Clostridiales bacterium]|nr:6-phosphofructokinase [Clostridiales bacterium]